MKSQNDTTIECNPAMQVSKTALFAHMFAEKLPCPTSLNTQLLAELVSVIQSGRYELLLKCGLSLQTLETLRSMPAQAMVDLAAKGTNMFQFTVNAEELTSMVKAVSTDYHFEDLKGYWTINGASLLHLKKYFSMSLQSARDYSRLVCVKPAKAARLSEEDVAMIRQAATQVAANPGQTGLSGQSGQASQSGCVDFRDRVKGIHIALKGQFAISTIVTALMSDTTVKAVCAAKADIAPAPPPSANQRYPASVKRVLPMLKRVTDTDTNSQREVSTLFDLADMVH